MADANLMLRISADIAQAEKALATFDQRITKAGQGITNFARSMAPISLAAAGALTAAGKEFMGLETSLAQMEGLAGVAADEIDGITAAIQALAPETGKGPQELAKALYFIRSSGLKGQEALDVLTMSAKASAAGLGETQVIADLLTSAMNAYGAENLSAAQATDILVAAVREGKGEAWALAGSLGQVMPIASEMGVAFDQVAASVAAMTRTGTSAETASMELKNILSALLKPSAQANEALDAMGLSAEGLRKQIREKGLLSALTTIREKTNAFGEDAMATVFPNIRALMGVLDMMGKNLEDNIGIFEALENSTGALDYAFGKISETSRHKLNQALATVTTSLAKFGDTVMDNVVVAIDWASGKVEALTKWWDSLDEGTQNFIVRAGLVVAAVGPVLLILGALTKGVGGAFNTVSMLTGGIKNAVNWFKDTPQHINNLGKTVSKVFTFATSPIGLAILAIGALIAIGVALYKNWDKIKDWAEKTWKKIHDTVSRWVTPIIDFIKGVIDWVEKGIEKLLKFLGIDTEARTKEQGVTGTQTDANVQQYATGGIVSGPLGRPQLAIVHGGEVVRTPAQERALQEARQSTPQVRDIVINATYHVTDRATAEHANSDLLRQLRNLNVAGVL